MTLSLGTRRLNWAEMCTWYLFLTVVAVEEARVMLGEGLQGLALVRDWADLCFPNTY